MNFIICNIKIQSAKTQKMLIRQQYYFYISCQILYFISYFNSIFTTFSILLSKKSPNNGANKYFVTIFVFNLSVNIFSHFAYIKKRRNIMVNRYNGINSGQIFSRKANAVAYIKGGNGFKNIKGKVLFYQLRGGVLVRSEFTGLPQSTQNCSYPVFGFHIHNGMSCTGTQENPFEDAQGHYNPSDCQHPFHAGDMPPIFGADGRAISVFLSNRFSVSEIIGRTVILHANPDDFATQPSGNAGKMIACGVIEQFH